MTRTRKRRPRPDDPPKQAAHWSAEQTAAYRRRIALATPLAEAGLSVRLVNCLEKVGYLLVADLDGARVDELSALPNFGDVAIRAVRKMMRRHGAELKPPLRKKKG